MRRLLLFILICWPLLFSGTICNVVVGGVAAPQSEITWTYSGDGTWETTGNSCTNGYALAGTITPSANGNATMVGIYIDSLGGATAYKVALYNGATLLQEATISSPATGWNDVAITSTAVTTSNTLWVWFKHNSTGTAPTNRFDNSTNGKYSAQVYTDAWPSNLDGATDSNKNHAVRVRIQ